jgi:putative endonuclease
MPVCDLHSARGMPKDARVAFGKLGEDLACEELHRRGYNIVDRRFRTRCGELDIVAFDGSVLVFVEVKARSSGNFGTPFESVTWQKQQRLSRMAAAYLSLKHLSDVACRFDVVSVISNHTGAPLIDVLQGAFDFQLHD